MAAITKMCPVISSVSVFNHVIGQWLLFVNHLWQNFHRPKL